MDQFGVEDLTFKFILHATLADQSEIFFYFLKSHLVTFGYQNFGNQKKKSETLIGFH